MKKKKIIIFDSKEIEHFFKRIGVALTAFSIFLFIFLEIIKADYVDVSKAENTLFLALLYSLVLIIGFFVFVVSQKYDNKIINFFGIVVLLLPILLYNILQAGVKNNLYAGGNVVLALLSVLAGMWLVNTTFYKMKKGGLNKTVFYTISALSPAGIFAILRFTSWFGTALMQMQSIFDGILETVVVSLGLGIFFGLIVVPVVAILDKLTGIKE